MASITTCRTFARRAIRRLGRQQIFEDFPLLEAVLECGIAIGFEQHRVGILAAPSPTDFAIRVLGYTNARILGHVQPIPSDVIKSRPALRMAIEEAIAVTFEAYERRRTAA